MPLLCALGSLGAYVSVHVMFSEVLRNASELATIYHKVCEKADQPCHLSTCLLGGNLKMMTPFDSVSHRALI